MARWWPLVGGQVDSRGEDLRGWILTFSESLAIGTFVTEIRGPCQGTIFSLITDGGLLAYKMCLGRKGTGASRSIATAGSPQLQASVIHLTTLCMTLQQLKTLVT